MSSHHVLWQINSKEILLSWMLSDDPVSFAGLSILIFIYLFYLPCKAQDSILNLKDCFEYSLYEIRIVSVFKIQYMYRCMSMSMYVIVILWIPLQTPRGALLLREL